VEGAGFGLGGIITIVPDLGILSAHHDADHSELSLVYGFEIEYRPRGSPNSGLPPPAQPGWTSAASCWKKEWSIVLCEGNQRIAAEGKCGSY